MTTYNLVYPSSAELTEIAQTKMPRLTADRPAFVFFPITNQDAAFLMWEQLDSYKGLQQIRGLNGAPANVQPVGMNQYQMNPGYYGEYSEIDEQAITQRRVIGSFNVPVNIEDLVLERQDQLLLRRLDRIEWIIWTLISTGTFSVVNGRNVVATDVFPIQTFTATTPWTTYATSTPLADFSTIQLLRRGYSVSFGADSQAFMNRKTYNALRLNSNSNDLYGRRTQGLGTFNNLPSINALLQGDDLPVITVYDDGYLDDTGTFNPFIPDGKVVVVGRRPAGQVVGEYRMVRNANNPDLGPGPYMKVIDRGENQVPRNIEVHDGHNGGPVLFYPSAVITMQVF